MYHKSKLIVPFLLLLFGLVVQAQEKSGVLDNGFADFLFNSELHELAAEEYERLLYYDPENVSYLTKLIRCYTLTGNEQRLEERFSFSEIDNKEVAKSYFDLLFSTGQAQNFKDFYGHQKNTLSNEEAIAGQLRIAVLDNDWRKVTSHIDDFNLTNYAEIKSAIKESNFVKPGLAAAFSAVLPGSGRVYSRDTKDGLISLLFVGSFSYQSYRRFNNNGISDAGGWIFGGLALGFYLSNVYGSYQSAKFYNKKQNEKLYNFSVPKLLTVSP